MEKILITCPSCSPDTPVTHIVLKNGIEALLQCMECSTVHRHKKPREIGVKVIVSKEDKSFQTTAMLSGTVKIGDEFIVDDESTGETHLIQVTSIEVGNTRKKSARVEDIKTIWGRDIDEVTVKISLPQGRITHSIEMKVDGNKEFIIGEKLRLNHKEVKIKQIKLRKGGFKREQGMKVAAKYIQRIYAEGEKSRKTKRS